jgi:hypothetical protein
MDDKVGHEANKCRWEPNLKHAQYFNHKNAKGINLILIHHLLCICVGTLYPKHSYDILGARMLWKPKEARILKNLIEF